MNNYFQFQLKDEKILEKYFLQSVKATNLLVKNFNDAIDEINSHFFFLCVFLDNDDKDINMVTPINEIQKKFINFITYYSKVKNIPLQTQHQYMLNRNMQSGLFPYLYYVFKCYEPNKELLTYQISNCINYLCAINDIRNKKDEGHRVNPNFKQDLVFSNLQAVFSENDFEYKLIKVYEDWHHKNDRYE